MSALTPTAIVIKHLLASAEVRALVGDKIDPEIGRDVKPPQMVVRTISGRQTRKLAGASRLREARITVMCAALSVTEAMRMAETVRAVMHAAQNRRVGDHTLSVMQEGEEMTTWIPDSPTITQVTGYRVHVSGP